MLGDHKEDYIRMMVMMLVVLVIVKFHKNQVPRVHTKSVLK